MKSGLNHKLDILDTFGLRPIPERLRQMWSGFRGSPGVPPSKFGLSSLTILKPWVSIPIWFGHRRRDRLIPIYNLFNRTQTPVEDGWSVRVTQVRDFRGGRLTYDSHNGTDFAVPVGTPVAAPAAGRVLRVSNEFQRGGLKVFIDHGNGVATSSNHLARSFVEAGEYVAAGQVFALSGASGMDMLLAFPWTSPHVHFNVFFNGSHADPFAAVGTNEASLWLDGDEPKPRLESSLDGYVQTPWHSENLRALVERCTYPALQAELRAITDDHTLGATLLFQTTYFPNRFPVRLPIYAETYERKPLLSLPFCPTDFDGILMPSM